jgi:hypothetical protein
VAIIFEFNVTPLAMGFCLRTSAEMGSDALFIDAPIDHELGLSVITRNYFELTFHLPNSIATICDQNLA